VIGDLSRRRGRVEAGAPGQRPRGEGQRASRGDVRLRHGPAFQHPRAEANYSMQFDRYEEVPNNLAEGGSSSPHRGP